MSGDVLQCGRGVLQPMTQPKDPPLSVRLPKPLLDSVQAWATERGINRNAAVVQLIKRGLVDDPKPAPKPKAKPTFDLSSPPATTTPSISVPFGGDVVRRPMQKGATKRSK